MRTDVYRLLARTARSGGRLVAPDAAGFIFDPATQAFTRLNDSIEGHWYPTLTKLGNGDVYAKGKYDTAGRGVDACSTPASTPLALAWPGRATRTCAAKERPCSSRPLRTNT